MILAIDIGNSRIGLAILKRQRITARWSSETSECTGVLNIARFVRGGVDAARRKSIEGICISSVVPDRDSLFRLACRNAFGLDPLFVIPQNVGLKLSGYDPKQVGVDRLVNALAVYRRYRRDAIVIDAGTCITFDAVTADGRYLGGAIVPGISLAVRSLHERAARIPEIEFRPPRRAIGKSTEDSVRSGVHHGYAGLVENLIIRIAREMKGKPIVVATGGDAKQISRMCGSIKRIHPDLAFEGIASVWENHRARCGKSF